MSMVPIIASMAFICGGMMLFEDLKNEIFYIESKQTNAKYERMKENGVSLTDQQKALLTSAKIIIDNKEDKRKASRARISVDDNEALNTFIDYTQRDDLAMSELVLKNNPRIKKIEQIFPIIAAVMKKDSARVEKEVKEYEESRKPESS